MKKDYKIFDSDIHCVEPPDLFERFIDAKFRQRVVRSSELAFECVLPFFRIDEQVMPAFFKQLPAGLTADMLEKMMGESPAVDMVKRKTRVKYRKFYEQRWSGRAILGAMDEEGIDVTVVFPTSALLAMGVNDIDPEFAAAIARAYNDYLADLCSANPGRLYGAAMVSVHDVGMAIAEAERAVKKLGFKAVFLRPNLVSGRTWYDPHYDPLWKAIAALGVPLAFHEGIGAVLPHAGDCFGSNIYLHHVACHPLEMMLALMNFCGGGILARHPTLRVAFLEGNVGWVPWLLDRLDDHYEMSFGVNGDTLPEKPSIYFKRQCFLSAECDETMIGPAIARLGSDNFVFSSDFPHPDSKYPRSMATFIDKDEISSEAKRKILWNNCVRLYGMERELGDALPAARERVRPAFSPTTATADADE